MCSEMPHQAADAIEADPAAQNFLIQWVMVICVEGSQGLRRTRRSSCLAWEHCRQLGFHFVLVVHVMKTSRRTLLSCEVLQPLEKKQTLDWELFRLSPSHQALHTALQVIPMLLVLVYPEYSSPSLDQKIQTSSLLGKSRVVPWPLALPQCVLPKVDATPEVAYEAQRSSQTLPRAEADMLAMRNSAAANSHPYLDTVASKTVLLLPRREPSATLCYLWLGLSAIQRYSQLAL